MYLMSLGRIASGKPNCAVPDSTTTTSPGLENWPIRFQIQDCLISLLSASFEFSSGKVGRGTRGILAPLNADRSFCNTFQMVVSTMVRILKRPDLQGRRKTWSNFWPNIWRLVSGKNTGYVTIGYTNRTAVWFKHERLMKTYLSAVASSIAI